MRRCSSTRRPPGTSSPGWPNSCSPRNDYQANTIATTQPAIEARRHLTEMADREGFTFDAERRGHPARLRVGEGDAPRREGEPASQSGRARAPGCRRRGDRGDRARDPAATSSAASSPRATSPATSTNSPAGSPRRAAATARHCASMRASRSLRAAARTASTSPGGKAQERTAPGGGSISTASSSVPALPAAASPPSSVTASTSIR